LKLIKATYVQVCWQFGDNFSEISSFLSSSQILERLAFYLKRRRRAAAVYVCDLFEILQSYSCKRLLVFGGNFSPICCGLYGISEKDKSIWHFFFVTEGKDWSSSR